MKNRWDGTRIFTELDFIKDELKFEKKYGKNVKYVFEGKLIKGE